MNKQTAQILTSLDIEVETFVDHCIYDACLNNHNVLRISASALEEGEAQDLRNRGFKVSPPHKHKGRTVVEIKWLNSRSMKHQLIKSIINKN